MKSELSAFFKPEIKRLNKFSRQAFCYWYEAYLKLTLLLARQISFTELRNIEHHGLASKYEELVSKYEELVSKYEELVSKHEQLVSKMKS